MRDNFNKIKLLATFFRTVKKRSWLIAKRTKENCFALSNLNTLPYNFAKSLVITYSSVKTNFILHCLIKRVTLFEWFVKFIREIWERWFVHPCFSLLPHKIVCPTGCVLLCEPKPGNITVTQTQASRWKRPHAGRFGRVPPKDWLQGTPPKRRDWSGSWVISYRDSRTCVLNAFTGWTTGCCPSVGFLVLIAIEEPVENTVQAKLPWRRGTTSLELGAQRCSTLKQTKSSVSLENSTTT